MSKRLLSLAGEETGQTISTGQGTALQRMLRAKRKDMAGLQAENARSRPVERGDMAGQRSLGNRSVADNSTDRRADMAVHVLGSISVAKGKVGGGSVALLLVLNLDMAGHFVVRREATHLH